MKILLFIPKLILKLIISIFTRLRFSMSLKIVMSYVVVLSLVVGMIGGSIGIFYFYERAQFKKTENFETDVALIKNSIFDKNELKKIGEDNELQFEIYNLNELYYKSSELETYDNSDFISEYRYLRNHMKYRCFVETQVNNYNFKIVVFYDMLDEYNMAIDLFKIAGLIGAGVLILFLPIFIRMSRNMMRPIKIITKTTKNISVNNMNERLDVGESQFELEDLSETINSMLDRIEEGYKSQQKFVSDASHELRTPIAVIKGYADMLNRWGKDDPEVLNESILAIKNEAESMQDLVEKLLFIARNDKNALKMSKELFSSKALLEEIEKDYTLMESTHDLSFNILNDDKIYADRNSIKQATRIFIENAIKYTPGEGTISVAAYSDAEYCNIAVKDNGIGIKKSDMKKIFDRLYRAEESRDRNIGGYGLGLSIARIIVKNHEGRIKVKSKFGEGTTFTMQIPLYKK